MLCIILFYVSKYFLIAFREALTRYREWKSKMDTLKQHKKESKSYAPIKVHYQLFYSLSFLL